RLRESLRGRCRLSVGAILLPDRWCCHAAVPDRAPSLMPERISPDPDVIALRAGEELDASAVGAYLAGKLPEATGTPELWQFPGGHANLTYLIHYPGGRDYVLRRPPPGDLPASAHDMGREYRVLSVLYRTFPAAPRAFLYCEDRAVIGAPFFVMERRRGTVV